MRGRSVCIFLSCLCFWGLLGSLSHVKDAAALIVINEIYADPAAGPAGDANGDGIRSAAHDEFVELLNSGPAAVDLTGWSIHDAAATRHIFPSGTLFFPYTYLVVFGGGTPALPGIHWQTASTGTLSLNNTLDTVTLFDAHAVLVNQLTYGTLADKDQSLVRFPEGLGSEFLLHKAIPTSGGKLFSPGTDVEGNTVFPHAAVPEPPVWACFSLGIIAFILRNLRLV